MSEHEKLASVIARQIEDRIIAMGWPVGASLGSEADLIEHYGVSRVVVREAVRLLEHRQVASMRRGPGGGLTVDAPAPSAIAETVSSYFTYSAVEVGDVFTARRYVDSMCLRIAAERLSERGIERLRRAAQSRRAIDLHDAIANLTRNPALSIIAGGLHQASPVLTAGPPSDDEALARSCSLVELLLEGEVSEAEQILRVILDRQEAESVGWDRTAVSHELGSKKLPERLAYQIYRDLGLGERAVGDVVGSEHEFLERYDISRSAFRQTVRILEYYDIIQMRQGRNGGMTVSRAAPDHVLDAVVAYLDFMRVDPKHLAESRRVLELAALDLAMTRLDDQARRRLRDHLEQEADVDRKVVHLVGPDFHLLIAELSGNRPITFFAEVLARLQTTRIGATPRTEEERYKIGSGISHAHTRVVEAMLEDDKALARYRLDRHLAAMTENVAAQRVVKPLDELPARN
ncbi:MAG: FadR/GntR family transcriptional regulator [Acidimicrobiales bacterium]